MPQADSRQTEPPPHTHTHTHAREDRLTYPITLSLSLSLSHTHTHTHTHSGACPLPRPSLSLALSLSFFLFVSISFQPDAKITPAGGKQHSRRHQIVLVLSVWQLTTLTGILHCLHRYTIMRFKLSQDEKFPRTRIFSHCLLA